jgi:hypothetical protein
LNCSPHNVGNQAYDAVKEAADEITSGKLENANRIKNGVAEPEFGDSKV